MIKKYYYNGPKGIPGNDDYGTMGAWVALWQLGIYPMASSDYYVISTPYYDDVSITLPAIALKVFWFI